MSAPCQQTPGRAPTARHTRGEAVRHLGVRGQVRPRGTMPGAATAACELFRDRCPPARLRSIPPPMSVRPLWASRRALLRWIKTIYATPANLMMESEEAPMRVITLPMVALTLLSSAALAQPPETSGDTIGHPPPLASPPPIPEPSSTTQPAPAASTPRASTYGPSRSGDIFTGTGLATVGPDGSTKIVEAVPCSTVAHETDGFTTCVGIPEKGAKAKKRR